MIKVKLEKNKQNKIIFKLKIKSIDENNLLFKRAIIEGKKIKGRYNYEIPLRFFVPIFRNINKEELVLDIDSILSYLEFSDFYDEKYYNETEVNINYMKKWREEDCPNIYRVTIDKENYSIKKDVVFKKPIISFDDYEV
ncbi:hypothetical protein [Clostridium weizhouense]|uniref:Uncharacterized protein n=1 Tax=Clostridium weizhouense TaxID=2859781 RepID=A0ABS7AS26_9CLOT|nr:hypothetical protein [Clostridium weizhouense]MBW6410461.1 hypothetical protein [Clostridium weizhouense]